MTFEPVFSACLPASNATQAETGAAGAGYNSTHHANHELAALRDIDTPERVVANLFADVDAARWILLIVMIFTSLLAYTMLMILEKDAGNFRALSSFAAIALALLAFAATSAEPLTGVDLGAGDWVINRVDERLAAHTFVADAQRWIGIPCLALATYVIQVAFFRREQNRLGVLLLDNASQVLATAGLNVNIPTFVAPAFACIGAWLATGFVYLSAMSAEQHLKAVRDDSAIARGWHGVYRGATAFHVFFCFWLGLFFVFCVRCAVATHVVTWYWAREPREVKLDEMTLGRALARVRKYHAGSLSLLALYVPWMVPFRIAYQTWLGSGGALFCYLKKPTADSELPPKSTLLAYRGGAVCQIALHGCGMKRGCFNQYHLKMRAGGVARQCVDGPGAILFVGGAFVSLFAACATVALCHLDGFLATRPIQWSLGPAFAAFVGAAWTYAAFFIAYREAVESVAQCFCEDTERNDGTPLRSYYMPEGLKRLIFVQVQGNRPPRAAEGDADFEREMRERRREKREERRERREARQKPEDEEAAEAE